MTDNIVIVDQPVTKVVIAGVGAQGATGNPGLVPIFTRQNEISVLTGKSRFYFDSTRTISQIRASVGVPATGSSIVVDTLINEVSIGSVTIPAGSYTTTLAINKMVYANDYATVSILSVGSTYQGADLTLVLTIN